MFPILIYAQKNKLRVDGERLRDVMDPFLIPTERFIERYRIPPYLVQKLIREISPYAADDNDQNIPLHLRVLATLSFFGSGCYQRGVGMDAFVMMSQSTVSKWVTEISRILAVNLGPRYIRFPQTRAEVEIVKRRFYEDHGLNGVMGLVDGTLVRVAGIPLDKKSSFMCRRKFTAINTQIIIDTDMSILNINARFPGSTHDTRVWHNSEIFSLFEENFNLPNQNDNIYHASFLLGDSGYPLEPWLMIPFDDLADDQLHEHSYNKKQRKIRNKIERFNACFKNRWRCNLGERALRYHVKTGINIYACARLHNFLIHNSFDVEYQLPRFVERDQENDEEDERAEDYDINFDIYDENLERGKVIRDQLVADYF